MKCKSNEIDATFRKWRSPLSAMRSLFLHGSTDACTHIPFSLYEPSIWCFLIQCHIYNNLLHFHAMFIATTNTRLSLQLTYLCTRKNPQVIWTYFHILCPNKMTIYVGLNHFACFMSTIFFDSCITKSKKTINFMQQFYWYFNMSSQKYSSQLELYCIFKYIFVSWNAHCISRGQMLLDLISNLE